MDADVSLNVSKAKRTSFGKMLNKMRNQKWLYIFTIPGILFYLVFAYYPMFGILMAFQDFDPSRGFFKSPFVGFDNFHAIFSSPTFLVAFRNSFIISLLKLIIEFPVIIIFAVMINELKSLLFKKFFQTVSYLPYFISWVVAAGLWYKLLSPDNGLINSFLVSTGLIHSPFFFFGSNHAFLPIIILSDLWKNLGFSAIIYLAALSGVDPSQYEAASIDGAGRLRKIWHVALPGIRGTIVLLFILSCSSLMSAGFDQLWTMGNVQVQEVGEIMDTLILRYLQGAGGFYGVTLGATMGVFQSVMGLVLFLAANSVAKLMKQESLI